MFYDDSGYLHDPCWDCPYWNGCCALPVGEKCPEDEE